MKDKKSNIAILLRNYRKDRDTMLEYEKLIKDTGYSTLELCAMRNISKDKKRVRTKK